MSEQTPRYVWEETTDGLRIEFPLPDDEPVEESSPGCAMAALICVAVMTAVVLVVLAWQLIDGPPADSTIWIGAAIIALLTVCFLIAAVANYRRAKVPKGPVGPSVLHVREGELKIERVGRDRRIDVSWELSEISDIRLCPAAPDRMFLSFKGILKDAISGAVDDWLRVSVQLPSGEVEDVMIVASSREWADECETKLRTYLGMTPGIAAKAP